MNLTAGGIVWVRDKVLAAVPCSKSHSIILQRLRLQISLDYYTIPPATQASTCTLAGIFWGYIISTQNKHFIHRLTSPVSKQCIHEFPIALTLILLLSTGQPESPSPFVSGLFFGGRPVLIKRYMIPLFFPLSPTPLSFLRLPRRLLGVDVTPTEVLKPVSKQNPLSIFTSSAMGQTQRSEDGVFFVIVYSCIPWKCCMVTAVFKGQHQSV